MNPEDKRVITKQLLESKYARVNQKKQEREARTKDLVVSANPARRRARRARSCATHMPE